MWPRLVKFVVASVVLFQASTGFFASAASLKSFHSPVALIHHPKAALDYFLKTELCPGHENPRVFGKDENLDRLVDAISFSLPQDRRDYVSDECAFFLVGRLKAPRITFTNDLVFTSELGQHKAFAQIYHAKNDDESWAIAPGFHEGVLIVFNRPKNESKFDLFGLLERPPDTITNLTQEQLETRYVFGRFDQPTDDDFDSQIPDIDEASTSSTRRSLCDLDDHERFRACSVGYLAWNYSGKVTNDVSYRRGPEGNYVDLRTPANRSKCLRSVVVVDLEIENKLVSADVIPCAVNRDAMHANFFLAADRFSTDSMFKVTPIWKREDSTASIHSIDDETKGYKLELLMSNVRVLKSFPEPQKQTKHHLEEK